MSSVVIISTAIYFKSTADKLYNRHFRSVGNSLNTLVTDQYFYHNEYDISKHAAFMKNNHSNRAGIFDFRHVAHAHAG